jgi:hypothetical protein
MIDFIANFLFQDTFICLTLHSGIGETDIEEVLLTAIDEAQRIKTISPKKRVWLLFDEFNTCPFQCLISEIMTERRCTFSNRIDSIPDNLVLIAACNPYRIKLSNSKVGLSHESTTAALSHRVYPIPQSLIDYIWDFGRLSDEVETEYIRSMITNDKEFPLDTTTQSQIAKCIITSQKYLRESETDSSVSLRDVQRFLDLYVYFRLLANPTDQLIMSVYLCYILRIEDKKGQTVLTNRLRDQLGPGFHADWSQRIGELLKEFEEEVARLVSIPGHISLNRPLVENLLAIVVATINSMPAIICGKPGTSKTVSVGLANDLFNLPTHRKQAPSNKYFRDTHACIQLQFWGSTSTTSAGVAEIFAKARKVKETEKNYVCIVFDEIGLAEIADSNPLKVLHSLLESTDRNISFIGLSNWKLDLSKMNRVIYVARPDMDAEDLFNTCRVSREDTALAPSLRGLSKAYHEFRKQELEERDSHPNFHGSRDFYQMIRLIKTHRRQVSRQDEKQEIGLLVESAIMRNFSGKGKESSDRLLREYRKEVPSERRTDVELMSSIDLIFQNMIDGDARHLMVFCETQDIEELIVGELRRFEAEVKGKDPCKFVQLRNTRGAEDLHHLFVNMQMYIKQGYTVVMKDLDVIYGCLYDLLNQNYTVYEGRKSCNLFFDNTKHKVTVDPEFKCIIVVEDERKLSKELGFEKRQQPPFLNRFEKHRVTYDDLIQSREELEDIRTMEKKLIKIDQRDQKKEFYPSCKIVHNLSKELLYSKGLDPQGWAKRASVSSARVSIDQYYTELLANRAFRGERRLEEGPRDDRLAQRKFDSLQSRNFILNKLLRKESEKKGFEEYRKTFLETHRYNKLEDLLRGSATAHNYIVFTYSPSWMVRDLVGSMAARGEVRLVECCEINSKGIVDRDSVFRGLLEGPGKVLLIQFRDKAEWRYIQDFRYKLDGLRRLTSQEKTIVLVAHTTFEDVASRLLVPTSINLITPNWEMLVIDNLAGCNYEQFFALLDSSFDDIRSQKSGVREVLSNVIVDALNGLISCDTNNYEGLVSVREQIRFITGSQELLEWLTGRVKEKARSEKVKLYEYIAKDLENYKVKAELHLDALDFVTETIKNFFVPAVQKVLEDIERKAGFGVLVLAGFVSAECQAGTFSDWLAFIRDPDSGNNPFCAFMFAQQKEGVCFRGLDKKLKDDLLKASDLIKQANRSLKQTGGGSISFNGEEVEPKKVKEKIEGIVWSLVKVKTIEGTEGLTNDYGRPEEKLLLALQVAEVYLLRKGVSSVGQTLRILSVMVQTTFSRHSKYKAEVEGSLKNTIALMLVLWNLHRKEIEFLVRSTADKPAVELVRESPAIKFYGTYSILSCSDLMGKLFLEQDVTEPSAVQAEIRHFRYFLENIDVYTMDEARVRCLKLLVGFLQAWPPEWCQGLALEYNKLRRIGGASEDTLQSMLLEIIQLAVSKAEVGSLKEFLEMNLLEILAALESNTTDSDGRREVFRQLFRLTFREGEKAGTTRVAILARFVCSQRARSEGLDLLGEALQMLEEQWLARKKGVGVSRAAVEFYSHVVDEEASRQAVETSLLLQDLKGELEVVAGIVDSQRPGVLSMADVKAIALFKARLKALRRVETGQIPNFNQMTDRIVRGLAGEPSKATILLILLRELYGRYLSVQAMRAEGLKFTADLIASYEAVRNDRFVVVDEEQFTQMKAIYELIHADPDRFLRMERLNYFEKLELLNVAFFGAGCQSEAFALTLEQQRNSLLGRFIGQEQIQEIMGEQQVERDVQRAFFVIGHGVNLVESNPLLGPMLRGEDQLLLYPDIHLHRRLLIRNMYDTRANAEAFKAVWECTGCRCPVILDHCGDLAHNDSDPNRASKCLGCGIDIGRGHANLEKIDTMRWQGEVQAMLERRKREVDYEELAGDKSWRREVYPTQIRSEEAATVVHLIDYVIKYARYLQSPFNIEGCQEVQTHLLSHIMADLRLLSEKIGRDQEAVTSWINLLFVDLNLELQPAENQMQEAREIPTEIGKRIRTTVNRVVQESLPKLERIMAAYGDIKNEKMQNERGLKESQRDYVRGSISGAEIVRIYGQRMVEISMYLKEKPPVNSHSVIESLQERESLQSRFLVRVLQETELWQNYAEIMYSLRRFSSMISDKYRSRFSQEQCASSITLNDLFEGNDTVGEADDEFEQEFKELAEVLQGRLYPLIQRHPDYFNGSWECTRQQLLERYWLSLHKPENKLSFYVVPINNTSALAAEEVVMESLLKCLADIQNKFLQSFSSLSINFQRMDNHMARRVYAKCSEDCFVSFSPEIQSRILENVFVELDGENSLHIDEIYLGGLVADRVFTNNVQEILVEPMFEFLVAEWSQFKQLVRRVEKVTRGRHSEEQAQAVRAKVKTCTKNPKMKRFLLLPAQKVWELQRALLMDLPRVLEEDISECEWIEKVLRTKEVSERREQAELLRDCQILDLEDIRRVLCLALYPSMAVKAFRREEGQERPGRAAEPRVEYAVEELKVLYVESVDQHTRKLSKEKETRRVEDLSDLLEEEDFTMLGDIMHELDPSVPQGSETGKKLTVKQFPSVIKAIEEKYTVK